MVVYRKKIISKCLYIITLIESQNVLFLYTYTLFLGLSEPYMYKKSVFHMWDLWCSLTAKGQILCALRASREFKTPLSLGGSFFFFFVISFLTTFALCCGKGALQLNFPRAEQRFCARAEIMSLAWELPL